MNQVEDDYAMSEGKQIPVMTLTTSNKTDWLFILDGTDLINDVIYSWEVLFSFNEVGQKIIDSCRKKERTIICIWRSPDEQKSVTILLHGVSWTVNWGSLGIKDAPSNVDLSDEPNMFLITQSYSASRMTIFVKADGKKKVARMKKMHVGFSYDRFNRKDRKKILKQVRQGKEIHLKNFIPADLRKVRSESFLDIEFKNLALIKLIEDIFKRRNPQIQFDDTGKVREKNCWNRNCQASETKLLKCTGCRRAQYCNTECQIEDWGRHVDYCVKKQKKRKRRANKTDNQCSLCLDKDSCVD